MIGKIDRFHQTQECKVDSTVPHGSGPGSVKTLALDLQYVWQFKLFPPYTEIEHQSHVYLYSIDQLTQAYSEVLEPLGSNSG